MPALKQFSNPETLFQPKAFSQVVAVSGGTTLYLAGQLPLDVQAKLVGPGEIELQTHQVFENIRRALAAHNASLSDIVQMTIYLREMRFNGAVRKVRSSYMQPPLPACTVIAVQELTLPEALIEIDAIAAL